MSSIKESVMSEIDALQQTRDELRVKLHLASGEVKDGWDKLERKWLELEDKAKALTEAAEHSANNIADAAHLLLSEVREGYQHLKQSAS